MKTAFWKIFGLSLAVSISSASLAQLPKDTKNESAPAGEAEIPAVKKSVMKSARTKSYNKALYFDQIDNGVVLAPPELEYDLTLEKGNTLKLGNVILNERTFFFGLLPLGKTHPHIGKVISGDEANTWALVMKYPDKLINHGTLEMISRTGTVIWKMEVTPEMRKKWDERLDGWKAELIKQGIPAKELGRTGIFGVPYAELDLKEKGAPFWSTRDQFRFCLSQVTGRATAKICSLWYGARAKGENVQMGLVRSPEVTPRVLVQNENAPLKGAKVVAPDAPTSFYAELLKGQSYEFVAEPSKLELMDIADTVRPQLLRVVGHDVRPTGPSKVLNPDQYSSFTKMIGFQETIGDFRKFWMAAIKRDNPVLYFPGNGGGVFKQKFVLKEIPRNSSRPYLRTNTPAGTYLENPVVYGQVIDDAKLSTQEKSLLMNPVNKNQFAWTLAAPKKGEINRSYLNVNYQGKEYRAFTEMYRGYSNELSGRFTGLAASGSFLLMGEIAYNKWFEDLFGWDNYQFSRLRWGVSAKYFQAFNKLKVDSEGGTAALSTMTLDAKYRLTPGLWGREETVGGILSYQTVTYDQIQAPMLGVGAFWARSMPKVFDDLFNYLPFMEYPKFVDMEFIYYMSSMKSTVTLQGNFALNFHGKVHWTKEIFGEAGFGLKRYAFDDASSNQQAALNTFYGTVGLGMNF